MKIQIQIIILLLTDVLYSAAFWVPQTLYELKAKPSHFRNTLISIFS